MKAFYSLIKWDEYHIGLFLFAFLGGRIDSMIALTSIGTNIELPQEIAENQELVSDLYKIEAKITEDLREITSQDGLELFVKTKKYGPKENVSFSSLRLGDMPDDIMQAGLFFWKLSVHIAYRIKKGWIA